MTWPRRAASPSPASLWRQASRPKVYRKQLDKFNWLETCLFQVDFLMINLPCLSPWGWQYTRWWCRYVNQHLFPILKGLAALIHGDESFSNF
jgi:hypothetical protein